jgi:endonuclease/exonuclease/phosphatase family metal-dependent hydrolase
MRVKLLSWNVAGRVVLFPDQAAAVSRREADLVALQEVRPSALARWRAALAEAGLGFAVDSGAFVGRRRLLNLTASRWELTELPAVPAPQPERTLSAVAGSPAGQIEAHNVHIPPAPGNGLAKVETCEALFDRLSRPCDRHRILCGDFNTPRYETTEGEVETFAVNHPQWAERWDAAERSILVGLREWDLLDVFRELNGFDRCDVSWVLHTRARRKVGHRLDHVLASRSLRAIHCDYLHEWREAGLSDHSAIEATFEPNGPAAPGALR